MTDESSASHTPTIDRRRLLQLAAAAGVVPFLPASTAAAQTTQAAAAAAPADACLQWPILSGPEFPIGAFWPPSMQDRFNLLERFQEMKDSGFNWTFVGASDADAEVAKNHTTLGFTDQVGLKAVVVNWPEKALELRNEYTRHPSFAGFRLTDEPHPDELPRFAAGSAALRAAAPNLLLNINLFPDGVPGGWRNYIHQFASTVKPQMLSYDRYPLLADGSNSAGYCAEWQEFRAAGLGAGVPTWIYILSVKHIHYRTPTAADLAWQVNLSLAYGCKGIQYFCYWSPEPPGTPSNYGPALIDYEGNRSPLYDAAKALHASWLAPAGAELKPLVSERVVHANGSRPPATQPFTPDAFVTGTSGNPVVLGTFRSKDRKPLTRWLLVANWSHTAAAQATVNVNTATVTGISRFDPATRTYTAQPSSASLTVSLAPGAAALYRLDAPGTALDPQVQLILASDSAVHHGIQQADDSWAGPNPLGGPARLVAASEFSGGLNVMEMTGDAIYHRARAVDGSWSTRNLFGELRGVSSMTAAVTLGCLQVAFAAGGVVHHLMQFPDGRWDGPNRLGDAANLVAATEFHGTFHLIQVEGSGRIYHRVRHGNGTWSSRNLFVTMAGITSVAVTVVGDEMMVVIAAGGQLYYAIQHTDGSWQWPTQTGDQADQVAASSVGGELQITATSAGQVYTRRRRADGTLTPRIALPTTLTNVTAIASAGRSVEPCH
ncbi:hypothetical protein GCM10029976_059010 [Kribbella albertanoniae]|uniref:Glycoside hydrolase family 42 N-terminal domain-containing protein n=1 Tax=Kribbella albertanoniae TaxID=1266829 RepID=A0A4R4Q2X6_9ACTN|nr:hypothetical protein [Kribbella albertanoniae]TDC29344.1 hypothetical protein E1261_16095 [Kribbella albertanoniae]